MKNIMWNKRHRCFGGFYFFFFSSDYYYVGSRGRVKGIFFFFWFRRPLWPKRVWLFGIRQRQHGGQCAKSHVVKKKIKIKYTPFFLFTRSRALFVSYRSTQPQKIYTSGWWLGSSVWAGWATVQNVLNLFIKKFNVTSVRLNSLFKNLFMSIRNLNPKTTLDLYTDDDRDLNRWRIIWRSTAS